MNFYKSYKFKTSSSLSGVKEIENKVKLVKKERKISLKSSKYHLFFNFDLNEFLFERGETKIKLKLKYYNTAVFNQFEHFFTKIDETILEEIHITMLKTRFPVPEYGLELSLPSLEQLEQAVNSEDYSVEAIENALDAVNKLREGVQAVNKRLKGEFSNLIDKCFEFREHAYYSVKRKEVEFSAVNECLLFRNKDKFVKFSSVDRIVETADFKAYLGDTFSFVSNGLKIEQSLSALSLESNSICVKAENNSIQCISGDNCLVQNSKLKFKGKFPSREGKVLFNSGESFEGSFKEENKLSGRYIFPDDVEYEGEFRDRQLVEGRLSFKNQDIMESLDFQAENRVVTYKTEEGNKAKLVYENNILQEEESTFKY